VAQRELILLWDGLLSCAGECPHPRPLPTRGGATMTMLWCLAWVLAASGKPSCRVALACHAELRLPSPRRERGWG
jgi:hypothetical protein